MIEVADILREHFSDFLASYNIPYEHYKAVNALINCRTAALGAHESQSTTLVVTVIAQNVSNLRLINGF